LCCQKISPAREQDQNKRGQIHDILSGKPKNFIIAVLFTVLVVAVLRHTNLKIPIAENKILQNPSNV
jgi:hypothetical protein